ncbi:MAG TPA: AAA family ATPase, partial [Polyangiales bacterium]|nr:AAA family ATPase [Polyangiales bacterium]
MVRLRKLLGHKADEHELVVNVHGRGYRFVRPVVERDGALLPLHGVAPRAAATPAPFVGRDGVLRGLRAALRDASAGRGSVCVISGEPGIGKTRLVEELERDPACAELAVAWGYCREAGDTPPLWPFARLLRELDTKVPLRALAPRLGAAARELERVLPGFWQPRDERSTSEQEKEPGAGHAIAFGAAAGSHRVFDAVARCFALAAEHTPLMLVLDDLHRADPGSLALLRAWVDEIARTRVLVLCTLRSTERVREEPAASCLAYVLGHRNCTRSELGRLSAAEVASYVAALRADAGHEIEAAVFARSEGNPFFMTELARSLRDGEPLERIDHERLRLPSSALEIVRQRVRKLDDDARGVLSYAAVIGRSFELPVLQTVAQRDATALMASLDQALQDEVLIAAPDSKTAFAFAHELLRAVLYEALPHAQRRAYHLQVAHALVQRRQAADPVPAADIAFHFHAALPHPALEDTVRWCTKAARDAARVLANQDAVRYLDHALQALDLQQLEHGEAPQRRLTLLLWQALHARTYSPDRFEHTIRDVIRIAREQRAGAQLAAAALMLDLHPGFPPLRGSRAALEDALRLLPADDVPTRAQLLARLATSAPLAYDATASGEQLARAIELNQAQRTLLGDYTTRSALLYLRGGPADPAARERAS